MMRLFRDQAVRHRLNRPSGTVLNYSPWTMPVAAAALALSVSLLALIVFGHYTRAVPISGYLLPDGGILRVFAPQPGVIVEKRIKAGEHVSKGQTLLVLSADREGRRWARRWPGLTPRAEFRPLRDVHAAFLRQAA